MIIRRSQHHKVRGFTLPLTLIISAIILSVSAGISIILTKELYFSKLSRQSQLAYYAADDGLMCTLMVDDHYVDPTTGIGIFQYNNLVTTQSVLNNINTERQTRGFAPIALSDIKCATAAVFTNASTTSFTRINSAGNTETGITTSFLLTMDLGNGQNRCASVSVNKTATYRQIISRGYTSCPGSTAGITVERAIVNTSDGLGTATSTP